MPDKPVVRTVPKELLERIAEVTNKRARFVLDSIVKNGVVTTEEISAAGYEHPPRAARDARELGFPLRTFKVKDSRGRSIAAYEFGEGGLQGGKAGRRMLPKKGRDALIEVAGGKCQVCGAEHNLQVDHRIPYEVAGEPNETEVEPFQVLCGSCNRKKSWDCEHCRNWLELKKPDICRSCYWAEPTSYDHVAMQQQRRADIVWTGGEVKDFERMRRKAARHKISVPEEIKRILRRTTM
ncbi:MAG TPA: HNH endonuclease signature motif containing protein [Terriglobia bacterium]|nr:HNH endonuclease signature motif containing protein [Terriglobia bacterium]